MLCAQCGKNEAQKYIRHTGEGGTVYLCPDCYRRLYGNAQAAASRDAKPSLKECPSCGTTLGEFRKTGLLGCADCYMAFREELLPTVQFIQGRLRHTGKDPVRTLDDERRELEAELRDAQKTGDKFMEQRIRYRLSVILRLISGGEE